MTDLTEKWKAGELEWHKSYYCKNKKGDITVAVLMGYEDLYSKEIGGTLNFGYWEVLAPCDYEELQALKEENARQKELIQRLGSDIDGLDIKKMLLIVEVNNLKGLLKECQEIIEWYKADCGYKDLPTESILTKINEVLK